MEKPPDPAGIDTASIASDTIRESESAVVRPDNLTIQIETMGELDSPYGLVDVDGRPFDPALHMTKADGTPRNRGGKLVRLVRGGGTPSPKVAPKSVADSGDHLDLSGVRPSGGAQAEVTEQPPLGPLVSEAQARADAETIREGIEALRMLLAGDKGALPANEAARLDMRWQKVFQDKGWTLPIGVLVMALFDSGKSVYKASVMPEGKDTWADVLNFLGIKKKKVPDGAPLEKPKTNQQQQPAPAPTVHEVEPLPEVITSERFI